MAQRPFIARFSPNRTDAGVLEKIFVQRRDLLDQSVAVLRESALTENKHHLLFVGQRGCGKTHLLALIFHRLQGQPDLAEQLRIAWLNEDETSTSFLDLLVRIYRALSERYPVEFPADELDSLRKLDAGTALDSLRDNLVKRIGNRTVLVLIENLDSLFHELDEVDQRALRAFLQDNPVFAIAATAQSLFSGVSEREKPFFGFFDTHHLQPLTVKEATELLRNIAVLNEDGDLVRFLDSPSGQARIHAIHHLAGGNHRLYIVLSDFITKDSLDELVGPFEEMVDEQLTPYYQERLRWITSPQRKIVEYLCFHNSPIPVKDLAASLFMEPTSVSNQLQKLRELGYVRANPRGRESLYELAEPLMRLSMQVKGTRDHEPLRLIVDFLRVWFSRTELEGLLDRCASNTLARKYVSVAINETYPNGPTLLETLLRAGLQDVKLTECTLEQLDQLRLLALESHDQVDWCRCGFAYLSHKQFEEGITWLKKVADVQDNPLDIRVLVFTALGFSLLETGRIRDAVETLHNAMSARVHDLPETLVELRSELFATALLRRGVESFESERIEEAIADFSEVIGIADVPAKYQTAALGIRAIAFNRLGRTPQAIADLKRANESPDLPADLHATLLVNLIAVLLEKQEWQPAVSRIPEVLMLKEPPAGSVLSISSRVISNIFTNVVAPQEMEKRVGEIVRLYFQNGALTELGKALVHHLGFLKANAFGRPILERWLNEWVAVGASHAELQLPLRLLEIGISYLKTDPKDEMVLLALPLEERSILRKALGLDAEETE